MTLIAVKFIEGSDDVIEGLALPFGGPAGGRDLTGTYFDADTNFCKEWFPDGGRPLLYRHGFDPAIKASVIGRETGGRDDDRGHWQRSQLDKSHAYWSEVKSLVDAGLLFMSSGAVDHLVDVAPKTGAIRMWPWVETSLVPNPANPDQPSVRDAPSSFGYAVKSLDAIEHLAVLGIAAPAAIKGWLPSGTTPGDLDDGDFAWLASDKKLPDSERRKYPYKIHGKVDEGGWRAAWSFLAKATDAEFAGGPSKAVTIKKVLADKPKGIDVAKKDFSEATWDAQSGASSLANLIALLGDETDEPDQAAMLRTCIDALQRWIVAEVAEIGAAPEDAPAGIGFLSADRAIKEGARNSAADASLMQGAHDNIATVLGLDCSGSSAGKAADIEPVHVLAIKTGDGAETVSPERLAVLAGELGRAGLASIKEALGIFD